MLPVSVLIIAHFGFQMVVQTVSQSRICALGAVLIQSGVLILLCIIIFFLFLLVPDGPHVGPMNLRWVIHSNVYAYAVSIPVSELRLCQR